MIGISYTSSFILILSLSLISASVSATTTVETTHTPDISTTLEITATRETSSTAETSKTPDESTTGISGGTSGDPATTTVDTTHTPDISTTIEITATSETSSTAETSKTPDESTTGISGGTSGDPATTTVDTTHTPDISTTIEITATSETSSTAETSKTPDESTTGISGGTSGDPATTTVYTTHTPDISTTIEITATSETSNTAETSKTPDESTTGISSGTSGDPATSTDSTTAMTDPAKTTDDSTITAYIATTTGTITTSTTKDDTSTDNTATTTGDVTSTSASVTTTGVIATGDTKSTPNPASTTANVTTPKDPVVTTVNVTTTTTRSTQSTTKTTTAKPIKCEHGGTPLENNLACTCPIGYTGRLCSNVNNEIEVKEEIERTVQVVVDVNELFIADYENSSSTIYEDFVKKFKVQVNPFYSSISNFVSVDNIIISAGGLITQNRHRGKRSVPLKAAERSLKVKHDAIFIIQNEENADDAYDEIFKEVDKVLEELKNSSENITDTSSSKSDINEVCRKATQNLAEAFQKYFVPLVSDGKVTACVTACNNDHPEPKLCMNKGTCAVDEQGPTCHCQQTEVKWYLGEDCSLQVLKVGLYAGLGTVAAIVVITIAFLTAYLVITKRTVKRNKDIKQELVKEWLNDDFEWPPQKKTSHSAGTYDNPENSQRQDSLGRTDFSADRFYTQNLSPDPVPLRYLQRNQPLKMDRPQIRSSFEI